MHRGAAELDFSRNQDSRKTGQWLFLRFVGCFNAAGGSLVAPRTLPVHPEYLVALGSVSAL